MYLGPISESCAGEREGRVRTVLGAREALAACEQEYMEKQSRIHKRIYSVCLCIGGLLILNNSSTFLQVYSKIYFVNYIRTDVSEHQSLEKHRRYKLLYIDYTS